MELHDILTGLAVLIGLVGIVLVFLPGLLLQVVAVTVWAFEESTALGWVVLAVVVATAIAASIIKYLVPGRRLRAAGIPGWVLLAAMVTAVVGLFVIPVVGAPIGFVGAVYVFERTRKGKANAWPSTKRALGAVATSIGIEMAGGFLIAVVFFATVLLT